MNEVSTESKQQPYDPEKFLPPATTEGLKLLRKVVAYHLLMFGIVVTLASVFPAFLDYLPIGGLSELEGAQSVNFSDVSDYDDELDGEIVSSIIKATSSFDSLGYARELLIVLICVWFLVMPVSWVHKGIHKASSHDHSLDETTLILPGVVAAICYGCSTQPGTGIQSRRDYCRCAVPTRSAGHL